MKGRELYRFCMRTRRENSRRFLNPLLRTFWKILSHYFSKSAMGKILDFFFTQKDPFHCVRATFTRFTPEIIKGIPLEKPLFNLDKIFFKLSDQFLFKNNLPTSDRLINHRTFKLYIVGNSRIGDYKLFCKALYIEIERPY